jgi:trans-2,3-dihydro-3-hydroxyanthranilate isomerase
MSRRFVTLDVFTRTALAGNPLAVVLDSEGLNDHAMQAIAREFNLSETVFVCPPQDVKSRASLRIFTPARELPFAGHPTVGTAVLLGIRDHGGQHGHVAFDLEEKVGLVPCSVEIESGAQGKAVFSLPRLPSEEGKAAHDIALAQAISLKPGDIGFERPGFGNHRATVQSAGVGFTFVPVSGLDALERARPDLSHWAGIRPDGHPNAFVYTALPEGSAARYRGRMFAPAMGLHEDPATGSAIAAFAGVVMAFDPPGDGQHRIIIEQGFEMGRPSQIELHLTVEGGELVKAAIGGSAVLVSEGQLHL